MSRYIKPLSTLPPFDRKHKYGDVREDGRIFAHYFAGNGKLRETWHSPEVWAKITARALAYRIRNKQILNERARERRHSDPLYYKKRRRLWYQKNADRERMKKKSHTVEIAAAGREYRARNRDRMIERSKMFHANHPDYSAMASAVRRNRLLVPASADHKVIKQIYLMRQRLTKCTGIKWHVDHVVPVSKGGLHHQDNLAVITARANQVKHAKVAA